MIVDTLAAPWVWHSLGLLLATGGLRFVAGRYPKMALLAAEGLVLLGWWRLVSQRPLWSGDVKSSIEDVPLLRRWAEALSWAGVPQGKLTGLVLYAIPVGLLFLYLGHLNRLNTFRSIPAIVVADLGGGGGTSGGGTSGGGGGNDKDGTAQAGDDAALRLAATVSIRQLVARSTRGSRRRAIVPGSPPMDDDLVPETALLPQTGWLAALTWLVSELRSSRSWDVTGTVVRTADGVTVAAEVVDRRTRRSVLTSCHTRADVVEAAEAVGYEIAAAALNQTTTVTRRSSWNQSEGSGLAAYDRALDVQRGDGEYLDGVARDAAGGGARVTDPLAPAQDWLMTATRLEPGNLLARLELAKVRELAAPEGFDAMESYLRLAVEHPDAVLVLYRAAISCDLVASRRHLSGECRTPPAQCERLTELCTRLVPESAVGLLPREERPCQTKHRGRRRKKCSYPMIAPTVALALVKRVSHGVSLLGRCRRVVLPMLHDPALVPTGQQAAQFHRAVKVAICVLSLLADPCLLQKPWHRKRLLARVSRRTRTPVRGIPCWRFGVRRLRNVVLAWWGRMLDGLGIAPVGWQAHYNAACFYSRLIACCRHPWRARWAGVGALPDGVEVEAYARAGLEHLRLAVYASRGALSLDSLWLREKDPDLTELRSHPGWEPWLAWMRGGAGSAGDGSESAQVPVAVNPEGLEGAVSAIPAPRHHPSRSQGRGWSVAASVRWSIREPKTREPKAREPKTRETPKTPVR